MTRLLIRNAGHEVRTPLNSIINYLEVALEETLDEQARHHLQKSLQASKSLVFVVNDLLSLTEAEDISFKVNEEDVNITGMISEVIASFKDEADKKNIEVVLDPDQAIPTVVRCDATRLRQVVSNLLANAIQNSEDGIVRIELKLFTTTEAKTLIEISFLDWGIGLSEQQLDSIFQDFEQILDDDESNMSASEVTVEAAARSLEIGLGLAVAARFVRLNYGQISISSSGSGNGTRVSIIIPFRKAFLGGKRGFSFSESTLPTPLANVLNAYSSDNLLEQTKNTDSESLTSSPNTASPTDLKRTSTLERYPFPATATSHGQQPQKLKVLIAEDNPLNSRLLETRLSKRGHGVRIVVNGQGCIEAFKDATELFDIILMDLQVSLMHS